ncbi:J domain-containing protein [Ornatilinea apprima]|uniref:J domain-containing protein n=1 Tax=Ornatilinea apprima TaxID=1134406 RepID=UPI0009465362|nr:J domain-containing protein [Ornatilinea apprima]
MNQCTLVNDSGVLAFYSPFNPALVNDLKIRIPATDRRWDNQKRCWLIAPQHGQTLAHLAAHYFNDQIPVPHVQEFQQTIDLKLIEVRYIGQCKTREDGSSSAFGLVGEQWSVVFPEEALRTWFEAGPPQPDQQISLFAVLGVKQSATPEEIKTGFRRMARQWHPDICKEPDAADQFMRIQSAYEILNDPIKRLKYEAGLALQATLKVNKADQTYQLLHRNYRAPLRCGHILVEGSEVLGRFTVSKIIHWEDIINECGQILVVSWPAGSDHPVESWI